MGTLLYTILVRLSCLSILLRMRGIPLLRRGLRFSTGRSALRRRAARSANGAGRSPSRLHLISLSKAKISESLIQQRSGEVRESGRRSVRCTLWNSRLLLESTVKTTDFLGSGAAREKLAPISMYKQEPIPSKTGSKLVGIFLYGNPGDYSSREKQENPDLASATSSLQCNTIMDIVDDNGHRLRISESPMLISETAIVFATLQSVFIQH